MLRGGKGRSIRKVMGGGQKQKSSRGNRTKKIRAPEKFEKIRKNFFDPLFVLKKFLRPENIFSPPPKKMVRPLYIQ